MFKQKRGLLMLVVLTLILGSFFTSPKNVIATELEDGEEVQRALDWIKSEQDEDGFWDEETYEVYGEAYQLYTTKVIETIGKYNYLPENYEGGLEALRSIDPINNDYLARYLSIEDLKQYYEVKELTNSQNEDGGWGILPGHSSNTVDTMLAVKALINNSQYHNTETMNRALQYLTDKQNHDGSWSYTEKSNPNIALTAEIIIILSELTTKTGFTSNELEISARKSGEYLISVQHSDKTLGTEEENINGTLLALRAISLSMGEIVDEDTYEIIKELQMENGSWYNDVYTTSLALSFIKEKDEVIKNDLNKKIEDIKLYKYENNEKVETYSFKPYETAIFGVEGDFEKDKVDITVLIKALDGDILTASNEDGYSWDIENSEHGTYTVIVNLKDKSTGRLLETFEKDLIIEKQFKISNVISSIHPKEVIINAETTPIIRTSLINESNSNDEVQIKVAVTDSKGTNILNKTLNQYCEKENPIINLASIEFNPNTNEPQTYKVKTEVIVKGQKMIETEENFEVSLTDRIKVNQKMSKETVYPKKDDIDVLFKMIGDGEEQSIKRKPKDIVIILDASNTTEEDFWIKSKHFSKLIINRLHEEDRASIVRYGTIAKVEQSLTDDKDLLENKIDLLEPNLGRSNFDVGIKKAIEEIDNNENKNERERLFVSISDGYVNNTVKAINEAYAAKQKGIEIYNIGLGNKTNENFLSSLATILQGKYISNPTSEQVSQLILEVSDDKFNISGKDVTLTTTVIDNEMKIDLTKLQPKTSEVIENEDGSKTIEWKFDKIFNGDDIEIKMEYRGDNLSPETEIVLTKDTKLTYTNKNNDKYILNLEDLKTTVSSYEINTSINTSKREYEPEENMDVTIVSKGYTDTSIDLIGRIDIIDSQENIVTTFKDMEIKWDANQDKIETYTWNLDKVPVGDYYVRIVWFEEESKIFEVKQPLKIIPIKEKYFNIQSIILNTNPREVIEDSDINTKIDISLVNDSNLDGEVQIDILVSDSNGINILEETINQYCKKEEQIIKVPEVTFKPNTEKPTTYVIKTMVSAKGQKLAESQSEFKVLPLPSPLKVDIMQRLNKGDLYPRIDDVEATFKLIGEKVSEVTQRKPIDLVIAIDDSGSMEWGNQSSVEENPNRLDFAKEAAKHMVDLLQAEDRAAIVEFAGHAWIQQDITHDKELLKQAIDNTPPSPWNGTGMGVGLRQSIDIFDKNSSDEREKIIMLICDGDENIWSHSSVIAQANQALQKDIRVHGIGLGTDVSHNLLKTVSSIAQGKYAYSPTMEELSEIMLEVAGEIFNIAGKEVKLTTTIPVNGMDIDASKLKPQASEIIRNEDGTKTIVWNIDKIIMGEEKTIKVEYTGDKLVPDTEVILTRNTKLIYTNTNNEIESIDLENLTIPVKTHKINMTIDTDKDTYKANEDVEITIETKNLTERDNNLKGKLEIIDKKGNIVDVISESIDISLLPKEIKASTYIWNTEKTISDDYYAKITWLDKENKTFEAKKLFEIIKESDISNQVVVNKIEYNSNETVKITDKINNPSENSIQNDLKLKNILIDDKNKEIWTNETKLKELLPNDSTSITSNWDTESNLQGEYTLISKVYKEDNLISEDSTKFIILDSKEAAIGVIGKLSSISKSIYPTEEINLTYKITNIGNSNLENIKQRIRIIDPETEEIIETITDTLSIEVGKTKENNKTWSHEPLKVGNYIVVYDAVLENGEEIPLDSQGFRVEKPEVSEKILGGSIFLNKKDGDNNLQIPLITQLQGNTSIYTGMTKYNDRVPIEINDGESSELFESLNDRGSSDITILNEQIKRAQTGGTYKLEITEPAEGRISSSNRIKTEYLTRVDKEADKIELNYGLTKEDVINNLSSILPLHSDLEYENYINGTKLFPSVSKPTDINITDSRNLNISPIDSKKEIDLKEHKGISTNRKLEIKERGELTLRTDPNTVIYLDRGIEISQGGKLNIEADGRLDIYINEQAQIDGSIFVNKGIGEVNIYMIGREDFHANNRAQLIGINLYAPDSEVQLDNHVEFAGTIICKHLQMDDTAKFRKH